MVQLEEVEDAELDQAQPGPLGDDYDSDDFVDTGKRRSYLFTYCKPHFLPSARDIIYEVTLTHTLPTKSRFRALRRRNHLLRPTLRIPHRAVRLSPPLPSLTPPPPHIT